jgi:UDP-N-acetylmuramoylalanine--D-glutamate ligase
LVSQVNGVRFIDDSKGTNVGATAAALEGLAGAGQIWLIIGGQGKGQDFSLLKPVLAQINVRLLVLGEATEQIIADLGQDTPIEAMSSLEDAVNLSAVSARPGDIVLLSPACASFDMFTSYVERGERFQAAVSALEVAA